MLTLLDTDTLSLLQRETPAVVRRAESYLAQYGRFSFTELTRSFPLPGLPWRGPRRSGPTSDERADSLAKWIS